MFDNESLVRSIARRVFPDMGIFLFGVAKIGLWDVCLSVGRGVAWLTVSLGRDHLFRIGVRGSRVEAAYALPIVVDDGNNSRYGTAWANSRQWDLTGWADVPGVSDDIREFFNNANEFCAEEAKVYKILGELD